MTGLVNKFVVGCFCWLLAAAAWSSDSGFFLKEPVAADFNTILDSEVAEVSVFSYQGRQNIFLIDFPDLLAQGRMFNRLVALIERIGAPRERVLSNEELAGFIRATGNTESNFAYGNDFLVSELVVFFNLADLGSVELTAEELALRQFLLSQKLMVMRMGFYQALRPRAVLLSLPQVKAPVTPLARLTILAHELAHAEYYTNSKYAGYCRYFWAKVMSEADRELFRQFLARSGYNPENREMMINEMQAYLMHTPDERAFSPKRLGLNAKQVGALRQKFRDGYPDMVYVGQ